MTTEIHSAIIVRANPAVARVVKNNYRSNLSRTDTSRRATLARRIINYRSSEVENTNSASRCPTYRQAGTGIQSLITILNCILYRFPFSRERQSTSYKLVFPYEKSNCSFLESLLQI